MLTKIGQLTDMMDNKARLDNLRTQIRGIFSQAARAAEKPAKADKDGWSIFVSPDDLKRDHGFALNTIKRGKDKISNKQIDHIIARWAEAQMLVVCPEIIEDTNQDIQDDVFKAIVKAEQNLSRLTRQLKDPHSGLMAADRILDDLRYALLAAP